jgi:uncharacterized protein (TIGR03437 family)
MISPLSRYFLLIAAALTSTAAFAQTRPPVVFVRGYDFNSILGGACQPSQAVDTFGTLPNEVISQGGASVLWFDQCAEAGGRTVSIATLGQLFGQFLTRVSAPQVDIVAHSMGGLIVRAYLAGMQPLLSPATTYTFRPPLDPRIRRAIFIATPHFGFEEVSTLIGTDAQLAEMRQGSSFLYELTRWNQGSDDLRGIDSIAIVGNSGTGAAPLLGNTDGIVSINSASLLSFVPGSPERTRALPQCHTGVLALFGFCTGSGIPASAETSTIVRSFLAGTNEWRSTGTQVQSTTGGVMLTARDASDRAITPTGVTFDTAGGGLTLRTVAFKDFLPTGSYTFTAQSGTGPTQMSVTGTGAVNGGSFSSLLVKPSPVIGAVIPSAGLTDARVVAPGQLVSLYGEGFAETTAQTTTLSPLPTTLAGASVSTGVTTLPLLIVTPTQANAYIPAAHATGLTTLTLRNAKGQHSTSLLIVPAAFTFFTLNGSGTGPGIAQHGADSSLVTEASPARPGEVIVIYGTGLGATNNIAGVDYANVAPDVTVGGTKATLLFAGRTPGFVGLDQLNLVIPLTATPGNLALSATSAGRTSNTVTVPVR